MSDFFNKNKCYSFNINVSTSVTQLSSFICSEALVLNKTGQSIYIYDDFNAGIASERAFLLDNNESFIFKGLTNSNNISCVALSGNGLIYIRTAYFSNMPVR